jgi:uncharacterized phage infection (PIP) family protein YhgE
VRLYLYLGVTLALAALLSFSHIWVYRHGKTIVRAEWSESVAAANIEANRMERARQRGVDEAQAAAAKRSGVLAADARASRVLVGGLRNDIDAAERVAAQSAAAADQLRAAYRELYVESTDLLTEIAGAADQHSSDVRLLREAWPK